MLGSDHVVTDVRRARNIIVERSRDRYEIDPLDQIRIQREADAAGLDVIGYYHSHPDHPAQASRFDTERAWARSEEHTSELQSHLNLVCRLLLEKKKTH